MTTANTEANLTAGEADLLAPETSTRQASASARAASPSARNANLFTRRRFVQLLGVAGLSALAGGALAGCAGGDSTSASSDTPAAVADLEQTDSVIIGVYSGDWEKSIEQAALNQFADDTGIDVQVVAGADAEWLTKLQAAGGKNVPYDLLILQPDSIQKALDAKLLQDLDAEHVPNLDNLFDRVKTRFTQDGKLYAAGFSMGQLGIAYRTDLVKKAPTSWADLWSDDFSKSLGISPLTYSAGLQFFWSQTNGGKDIDGAFDKMEQLKPNISSYPDGAGTIQTLLQRGDVAAVPFWDGRAFAWQAQGQPIGFAYPTDGPVAAIASWVIPQGAPNLANAYRLLDYLCQAEPQSKYADLSFYGMCNKNATYSDDFLPKAQVGEEFYNNLDWIDYSVATPNLADWSTRWQQIMG